MSAGPLDDPRGDDRGEPRQHPLVRDAVVAVSRVGHLPVDRQGDDRVPGDTADFQERLALAIRQVLEDLQRHEQVVRLVVDRPRRSGRIEDPDGHAWIELWAGLLVHDIGADDDRPDRSPELERGAKPVSPDQGRRLAERLGHVAPAVLVVGEPGDHRLEFGLGHRPDLARRWWLGRRWRYQRFGPRGRYRQGGADGTQPAPDRYEDGSKRPEESFETADERSPRYGRARSAKPTPRRLD